MAPQKRASSRAASRLVRAFALTTAVALAISWPGFAQQAGDAAGHKNAAVITIHGDITDITVDSVRRRIKEARQQNAELIVFDLDTPGGLVNSSIEIADLIRGLDDIKSVAWVNPDAYSGGSLVAVACDEIVMSRSSRIGDSQVIMGGPEGYTAVPEDLRPKVYTPVLHDFRTSAKLNGYSLVLCDAFVDPDLEVWWLENTATGEREFVFREEKLRRLGEAESGVDWAKQDGGDGGQWKLVKTYFDIILNKELPVAQPVVPEGELLQMSPAEAYAFGFCKAVINDDDALMSHYELASLTRFDALWSESLAHWLTSMPVRAFLLLVVFLAAYVEFHTPGVGLAGLVSLIALVVFVGAPYLTGLASIWEIVLIAAGILLLLLELFVVPGFGVAGVTGLVLIFTGLVATFIPEQPGRTFPTLFPALPATVEGLKTALVALVSAMIASVIGMMMLSRYLPKMPILRGMMPANPMPSEVLVEDPYRGAAHIGDLGQTESPLRPAGKARFGPVLVDVVAQGDWIEAGARVEVVERRGNRVVVRPMRAG